MKKRIIQSVIFVMGVFLFAVVLTPKFFNDKSDSKGVDSPSVVYDNDDKEYRMYYTGYLLGGPGSLHLATSKDGLTWEKFEGNPLIERSWAGSADSTSFGKSVVVKGKDGYKCFYFGLNTDEENSVCLAASENGIGWKKYGDNPVFSKKRPLLKSEDVKGWSEELIDNYLNSLNYLGYSQSAVEIDRGVWLEQFLRILQDGESNDFTELDRVNGMFLMAKTIPYYVYFSGNPGISDFEKVRTRLSMIAKRAGNLPSWKDVAGMSSEDVVSTISGLGILDETFVIDAEKKKDLLANMLIFQKDPFQINKTVWLEQFLRILQEGDRKSFTKFQRTNAMVLMAWTMPEALKMDFELSEFSNLLDKVKDMAGNIADLPSWQGVRLMNEEDIDSVIEQFGIDKSAFIIDKKDLIVQMLKYLEGDLGKREALRYFKAVEPSAFQMSRKHLPALREIVREKFTGSGLEGDALLDFSVIYDGQSDLYRLWYVGKKQYPGEPPLKLLGYAESKDGIDWERKPGPFPKGALLRKEVDKISVIICEDGMFRMAAKSGGAIAGFESKDGLIWREVNGIDVNTGKDHAVINYDDGGTGDIFLCQFKGKYTLFYGGNLNDWDQDFPTREEITKLSTKDLYKYAEMVGFRMSRWDNEYVYENLSFAREFLAIKKIVDSMSGQPVSGKVGSIQALVDSLPKTWKADRELVEEIVGILRKQKNEDYPSVTLRARISELAFSGKGKDFQKALARIEDDALVTVIEKIWETTDSLPDDVRTELVSADISTVMETVTDDEVSKKLVELDQNYGLVTDKKLAEVMLEVQGRVGSITDKALTTTINEIVGNLKTEDDEALRDNVKKVLLLNEKLSGFSDEQVRDLALYYWLELDIKEHDLENIDREMLIFAIRKSLLKRTFVHFGKAIDYPSVEEIEEMDRKQLVENCSKYAVAGIPGLDAATDEEMREGLVVFSRMCSNKKKYILEMKQEELIKIANDYDLSVKVDPRRELEDEVKNIPSSAIKKALLSAVKARRSNFMGQQRIITRIGSVTSGEFEKWERQKGDKEMLSLVTNNPHGAANPLIQAEGEVSRVITILGWFAVGLGLVNLTRHHGLNIVKRGKNYLMSVAFYISLISAFVIMCVYYPFYARFIQVPNPYKFMQNFIAEPIVACILGLLGYYITSAAYRAFRVQNMEAAVMMLIAVLCMLGNISIFEPLSRGFFVHTAFDQLHFPYLRDWLMNNANAAVFRGLNFGISIGVIAMSIRIILGLEKGAFFQKL